MENNKIFNKGIIDIGTSSCRLFIARVQIINDKVIILEKIYKETLITRLGTFITDTGFILQEGIDKVNDAINYFLEKTASYDVEKIVAFATSAIREASNQKDILHDIYMKTSIKPLVISGEKEGRLTFIGNSSEFKEDILLMDIGGGSTEFIYGNSNEIFYVESFKLGASRETKDFFPNDNYSKITDLKNSIRERLKDLVFLQKKNFKFVGVAGTITTNVSVLEKMKSYDSNKVHLYTLSKSQLENNLQLYLSLPLEKRKEIIGLQPQRGDSIVSGTIIILEVMEILNLENITASECDGLEGAMMKL